jgi:hypothetical protein
VESHQAIQEAMEPLQSGFPDLNQEKVELKECMKN